MLITALAVMALLAILAGGAVALSALVPPSLSVIGLVRPLRA